MSLSTPREDNSLHVAYATGCLKFLRQVATGIDAGQKPFDLGSLYEAAKGPDDDANFLIFEFIKDCGCIFKMGQLLDMGREKPEAVALLWRYVNADLRRFGHAEVSPVPLSV